MRKQQRFATKFAGVILATVVAMAGLSACGSASADSGYEAYLNQDKVDQLTCEKADNDTLSDLRTAAGFVKVSDDKQKSEILAINTGMSNIDSLSNALDAKITEIEACDASATAAPTATPTNETCKPEFTQVEGLYEGSKVDSQFEEKYAAATAEAGVTSDALRDLILREAGKNAFRLAIWSHASGLMEDPNAWRPLVDGNGNCLSSEGEGLFYQLKGALNATGVTFEEAEAPANGFNSGVSNGVYGVASEAGIRGDRRAIKVTLPDGTVIYIMVRCGNAVYPGKPGLPEVPTDNPPSEQPPTDNPPPEQPPAAKKPEADPYPRGNAPVGGGRNADPGPGTYIPPEQMVEPPSTPRVNPAPPPAAPPASNPGPNPAPVPVPDPAPAPPAEPAAPAPSNPVGSSDPGGGCLPPPGKTTC